MKALVVYYSSTGKTELVAKAIAKILNADIWKIEELKKKGVFARYISGAISAAKGEYSEIKPIDHNIGDYDLIFIGTPVWAFKPTPAINAFISKANFKDKKVIIFVTMRGMGGKSAIRALVDAIESKGGKIINSFGIRTGGVKDEKIIEKGIEIGRQYKN